VSVCVCVWGGGGGLHGRGCARAWVCTCVDVYVRGCVRAWMCMHVRAWVFDLVETHG
jgi:hypothetical protein